MFPQLKNPTPNRVNKLLNFSSPSENTIKLLAPPNPIIRKGSQQQLVTNKKAINPPIRDCEVFIFILQFWNKGILYALQNLNRS
jgi:hypothetical protein